MDLTFHVPKQYCSLQHQTLLPSPVTPITGICFFLYLHCFIPLELILHWSIVACWTPTNQGASSFSVLYFCIFILLMGFSRQEYWSGLPFPPPGYHFLSELSTMTHPSWVALHGMAYSFIELDKTVVNVLRLFSFLWLWFSGFQSVCPLTEKDKRLMVVSWFERLTGGQTGSCSDGLGLAQ